MIGKIEQTVSHVHRGLLGVFRGKLYVPMSERAPEAMRKDLQLLLDKAKTDSRIVVAPSACIEERDDLAKPHQIAFAMWVEDGFVEAVALDNAAFYEKLTRYEPGAYG